MAEAAKHKFAMQRRVLVDMLLRKAWSGRREVSNQNVALSVNDGTIDLQSMWLPDNAKFAFDIHFRHKLQSSEQPLAVILWLLIEVAFKDGPSALQPVLHCLFRESCQLVDAWVRQSASTANVSKLVGNSLRGPSNKRRRRLDGAILCRLSKARNLGGALQVHADDGHATGVNCHDLEMERCARYVSQARRDFQDAVTVECVLDAARYTSRDTDIGGFYSPEVNIFAYMVPQVLENDRRNIKNIFILYEIVSIAKHFQRFPKISKDFQTFPRISKDFQRFPTISKDLQRSPNICLYRCTAICLGESLRQGRR